MGLPRWVKSSDALLNTVSQHYNPTPSSTQHSSLSFHLYFTQICKAYKLSQDAGLGVLFWMYSLYHIYMPLIQTNSKHIGTSINRTSFSYFLPLPTIKPPVVPSTTHPYPVYPPIRGWCVFSQNHGLSYLSPRIWPSRRSTKSTPSSHLTCVY